MKRIKERVPYTLYSVQMNSPNRPDTCICQLKIENRAYQSGYTAKYCFQGLPPAKNRIRQIHDSPFIDTDSEIHFKITKYQKDLKINLTHLEGEDGSADRSGFHALSMPQSGQV